MALGNLYLARVQRDFHRCATYVRCEIASQFGGILAIKATRDGFDRDLFEKGRIVEVAQCSHDGRRFQITRVFEEVGKDTCGCDKAGCRFCAMDQERELYENRSLNDRKVRFWIGQRYRQGQDMTASMCEVLECAFEMTHAEARSLMGESGFWVTCRESQFTRFMYTRNRVGLPNLFQDLRLEYCSDYTSPAVEIDVSDRC